MIRAAWQVPTDTSWIAGLNYFRNLAHALRLVENRTVEPVVIGDRSRMPWPLDECAGIPPPGPRRLRPGWWLYGAERVVLQNGGVVARHLERHGVDLLTHSAWLGRRSRVPAVCWIPDFQHHHLPHFFNAGEIRHRERQHRAVAESAQGLIVSSEMARDDFARRYPESNVPVFVLHFVAPAREDDDLPEIDEVLEAHGISEPFLHVPNQLWAHKNHRVVLEALRVLRDRGTCPLVISTGQTEDYRDASFAPGFFGRLRDAGLEERFRFLGLIAYKDMATLMRHSIAMVNPSLFEGWSTTVEEAKSLGKRLLLSDIPVHREQDPERGEFFDPSDAEGLAEKITAAVAAHDAEEERREREKAESALPGRMRAFGEDYQRIVHAVVGGRR